MFDLSRGSMRGGGSPPLLKMPQSWVDGTPSLLVPQSVQAERGVEVGGGERIAAHGIRLPFYCDAKNPF